jgi:CHAT domain-containing protein/Tfp pilus assembly protein PilF
MSRQSVIGAAQGGQDAPFLETGKTIERELAGGQSHSYQLTLRADQYLLAVIDQQGIDVVVRLLGPDGKQIAEFDSEIRNYGQERVSQAAEAPGNYRLNLQAKRETAPAGRYEIRIVELRDATGQDRALQEGRQLHAEGVRLYRTGKYDEALRVTERGLEIREKVLGPDHPDVAASLNNVALLYFSQGDYPKAEPVYQRALAIREKALSPDHPDVAAMLHNLANLYFTQGDYAKAEPAFKKALVIREKALSPDHPDVARSLDNLAVLYRNKGDYAKAEPFFQRALAISERVQGPEHPDVLQSLNNLAVFYATKADYAKAEPLFQRALAIREKVQGGEHPDVAGSLNNLASLYWDKGEYAKAEPLFQRALAIREKVLGAEHPTVVTSLLNLGSLNFAKGDYARAEPLFQRALATGEKALGPEHPRVASVLNDLAVLYNTRGDYAKAEPLYQRALAIRERALGPEHPDVARSLAAQARFHESKGDLSQAITIQSRASEIRERNIVLNITIGSERQKLAYINALSAESDQIVSLHVRSAPNDSTAGNLAITTILRRKGRALDAMTDSVGALRGRASAEDQALFDQLKEVRAQKARLVLGGPQRSTPAQHQEEIRSREEQIERLEAEISRHSDEFRAQAQPITTAAIQSAIPGNAALIEFFVYRPFNAKYTKMDEQFGKPRYVAYILPPRGAIQWVDLGETTAIEHSVEIWRAALHDPNRADAKQLARALDEQLMRPVRKLLGKTRNLLLSPDGALNLIPFGALVDEQNRYLIESYSFTYLTSGRDLLRLQARTPPRQGPLVVANPSFDLSESLIAGNAAGQQDGETRRSMDFTQERFNPLPSTGIEARTLGAVLPGALVLTGAEATEAAIKQVRGPSILHIATHGFFLADHKPEANAGLDESKPMFPEDPLLRSGLILAGANQRRSGDDDDGILTASEVTDLDLWGTKLVVLSACDTGLGEVKNGQGVYGLRRALVLAGAQSQVMSLWEVADRPTRELMADYYKGLQEGQGRSEALRHVQLRMLRSRDRRHPYYWAAFIESGEWANLEGKR